MLLRGSSTRGARGQSSNRSRGSRGRGSTSRGVSNSSSKFNTHYSAPMGPRALQDSSNKRHSNYGGRNFRPNYSSFKHAGTPSSDNSPNSFEQERLENAAKREQRGHIGMTVNGRAGRGNTRGLHSNKQVRFADSPALGKKEDPPSSGPSLAPTNPFSSTTITSSTSGSTLTTSLYNPFAVKTETSTNPFGTSNAVSNPFGAPSQPVPPSTNPNIFGKPLELPSVASNSGLLEKDATIVFGSPSNGPNPFSRTASKTYGVLDSSSSAQHSSNQLNPNPFSTPSGSQFPALSAPPFGVPPTTFTSPGLSHIPSGSLSNQHKPRTNGSESVSKQFAQSKFTSPPLPVTEPASSNTLAQKMDRVLRKEGLVAPTWPTSTPGDPNQKGAVESFWQTSKGFRSKVRASLIRAGLLDDPDKPKKLSEAIDFKGTCEDMCPEFEKITRIMEHDVQSAEKEAAPDGSLWPSPRKMVKALARSAAGQDAPLPMDVRSPAALKRTLDYLLHTVLGKEGDLPTVHGFLWDRTRAIRRDFVFQSSMSSTELSDQVNCLERITRFHVIALHQMSRDDLGADDFSEQQEVEQLGKALLSLIHAYEDCLAQGISCTNEAEFRAYYILFNSHNSGILETVQDWGWKFWGESDQIRTTITLVETLQNIWDTRGPLKPHSATDIALNGYSRFFSIIEDERVSYTLACFAEIHFNSVRKSALKTILASYRKQREQTKDWTLAKLNAYLRFDDEEDVISFCEAYGLQFEEFDGEYYLSFESEDAISDPFPPLKQRHSHSLVERKRGDHPLPTVIDRTVYEVDEITEETPDEDKLFVMDSSSRLVPKNASKHPQQAAVPLHEEDEDFAGERSSSTTPIQSRPALDEERIPTTSIFDRIATPSKTLGTGSSTSSTAGISSPIQPKVQPEISTIFSKTPILEVPSTISVPTAQTKSVYSRPSQLFSFLQQPAPQHSSEIVKATSSIGEHAIIGNPVQHENLSPQSFLGHLSSMSPKQPPAKDASEERDKPTLPPKQTDQISLAQPTSGTGPTPSPITNHSVSEAHQAPMEPQKITPAVQDGKEVQRSSVFGRKPATLVDRKLHLTSFAKWVALGEDGLIDQFTSFTVERLLHNAASMFVREEADRIVKKADDMARQEADVFRYRSLATKYGHMWRAAAHRIWLKRRGREARKARQELAESLRASRAAQSAHVVEDFRASASSHRRNSLESLLGATGVMNGVHDLKDQLRAIVGSGRSELSNGRPRSEKPTNPPITTKNIRQRGKSENPLRRSLLSDPSYLTGGSRIHLLSNYVVKDESRRQVSGVQTDYFRLKARGITTLSDGTPLANSAAKNILHQKRSFDGIGKPTTPRPSVQQPLARSLPSKPVVRRGGTRSSAQHDKDIQTPKSRAETLMEEDKKPLQMKKKRTFEDDNQLFERAKRIREQMDEGAKWFKEEIERGTASRSVS